MPRAHITTNIARQHAPPDRGKLQLFDTELSGLMVEIRPSGGRTYYVRYQDTSHKTRQLRLGKAQELTASQAREKARTQLAQIRLGEDPANSAHRTPSAPTLRAFAKERYLPFARSYKHSAETDNSLLRTHLLPRFGDQRLDQITRYEIQRFIQELSGSYKPASVNRILILLRYIYNLALRWEVPGVTANPTHGIDQLKERNKRDRYLTAEELQRLFRALESPYNPHLRSIVTMLALTGARRGEVLQARWEDIDLDRAIWRIPQPKATERRHVPLSEPLIELLQSLETWIHSAYVFPNPRTGRPFGSIYYGWNRARRDAGLPELRLHDLRHSFASFLVNNGHSLYEVQKLLGHTQITTTQRYAHLAQERLLAASNNVARVLEPITSGHYVNEEDR